MNKKRHAEFSAQTSSYTQTKRSTPPGRFLFYALLAVVMLAQLLLMLWFGAQKQGFHYDEYYSYYSSNVTWGLNPPDHEFVPGAQLAREFYVAEGEGFNYGMVTRMQTYDVHPPLYYLLLHTVCSLTPGVFSKWSAIGLNLVFWLLSAIFLAMLSSLLADPYLELSRKRILICAMVLLFGCSPALISGVMMARMYVLLTFWITFCAYLHAFWFRKEHQRKISIYLCVLALTFLGFLTHYYFAVYMFFQAAVVVLWLLLDRRDERSLGAHFVDACLYGCSVLAGLFGAILAYPSCLRHIFRGYRGHEAMSEFINMDNTVGRLSFFAGLLNDYVFGSILPFILLLMVLLWLTALCAPRFLRKRNAAIEVTSKRPTDAALWISGLPVIGYFLVVAKTALLNAEEANRYELPVYGMLVMWTFLLFVLGTLRIIETLFASSEEKQNKIHIACLGTMFVVLFLLISGEVHGLIDGRVCFLYPEDAAIIEEAAADAHTPVIYVYNPANAWMIWDDSLELMQYDNVYYVNKDNPAPILEDSILSSDRVIVYSCRFDGRDDVLTSLLEQYDGRVIDQEERLYCDRLLIGK